MISMNKQARRVLSSSLLFIYLLGCASPAAEATATASPTKRVETPTATAAETPAAASRTELEVYIVQNGDTISKIAATFNLRPETVLWANFELLADNPDLLFPGMQLTILPVDGVYHQVGGADTLTSIANFFGADVQAIIDWPGNEIDANSLVIFPGQWLIVPGGQRILRRRLMPNLPRFAMAVSFTEFGSGACPQNSNVGIQGDGVYAWPVAKQELVGEGYWSAHQAADLAVTEGESVRAADDGVVVFSGWSNLGYGNMVMLDHGNNEFTLYGGLADAQALCGHSLSAGEVLGTAGITGHPVGAYLHFEIRRGEENLDPIEFLP